MCCINSPGGDVFTGQAIHSMLKRLDALVFVFIGWIGGKFSVCNCFGWKYDSYAKECNVDD
ncbi:hypothetical protein ACT7CX_00345 [Bacillus cereus]